MKAKHNCDNENACDLSPEDCAATPTLPSHTQGAGIDALEAACALLLAAAQKRNVARKQWEAATNEYRDARIELHNRLTELAALISRADSA